MIHLQVTAGMSVQNCRIRTERSEVHSYTGGLELRMTETLRQFEFMYWNFIMLTMENKILLRSFTEVTFVLRLGKCILNYLTQL